ncbi:MAG: SPOR domain-containing protein, partial [Pseudomonadota bacterium]
MKRVAVRAVLLPAILIGLAACDEGFNLGGGGASNVDGAAPASLAAPDSATRDVERPDIFSTTEEALWDGRPSLGGIWIAHPDVTTAERAIITNNTTNQRIAAALFRRERNNPGPQLQLSSDAAAALNILAGAPTEVTVVAVRPEEVEV